MTKFGTHWLQELSTAENLVHWVKQGACQQFDAGDNVKSYEAHPINALPGGCEAAGFFKKVQMDVYFQPKIIMIIWYIFQNKSIQIKNI